jgi:Fe-S-cluster containining protein
MSQRKLKRGKATLTRRDLQGRVHLVVERDAHGGNARVLLTHALFQETWQNEVTTAAANTAFAILQERPSLERIVELAQNAMAATSRLAEGLLANAPAGAVACKAGCDHCCYQSVGVTPPEALAIVAHLRATHSSDELAEVRQHIAQRYEQTRELTSAERFSPNQPCAFLVAGRCSIYEARPLSCRGMNSLDADECAKRLRDPETRAEFLRTGAAGHAFLEPIRAFHAISAGLQLSLDELYRLDMRPLDLIAAIHLALSGSDDVAGQWLRGSKSFEAARGGDSTSDAATPNLSGIRSRGVK